jgi:hypothetical protein
VNAHKYVNHGWDDTKAAANHLVRELTTFRHHLGRQLKPILYSPHSA